MSPQKVLILGSGAREHALALACARTAREIVIAPGPGGLRGSSVVTTRPLELGGLQAIVDLATSLAPDLVVVGPEAPLVSGVADALRSAGLLTFGTSKSAAELEGSKAFLKNFATRHKIPTASYQEAASFADARQMIEERGAPIVIKADGLCGGKGVVVASSVHEALEAADAMLQRRVFGEAGAKIIIESCIVGREVSIHAVSDGERYMILPPARDHKRLRDGDVGPNTGGMGVVCPVQDVDANLQRKIEERIIAPTIAGMRDEGRPFQGVLFAGVMVDLDGEPWLLEHNVRFGDPECEALMEVLEGDVAGFLASAARGRLDSTSLTVSDRSAVVVVLAALGYPQQPVLGATIEGIAAAEACGARVLHAGTKRDGNRLVVGGGRVLALTASDASAQRARERVYAATKLITFEGKQYRSDIGASRVGHR